MSGVLLVAGPSPETANTGVREEGPATVSDEISPRIANGRSSAPASSAPVPLYGAVSSHAALVGGGLLRALAPLGPMSCFLGSFSLYRSSSGQNLERAALSGLTAPSIKSGGGSGIFATLLLGGVACVCLLTVATSIR
jgi:hypothetical protein